MRTFVSALMIACLSAAGVGCQQKQEQHEDRSGHTHDGQIEGENQPLYDEVMGIHDEVMPKMNDLYKKKTSLKTRLELPGISESEKEDIQQKIARIDSASESMMVWMRQFDPVPESEGEDKARAYLQDELVKVKKVKEKILTALKNAE
jgi:hypothetical protein